jgi:hypothetical protein
MGTQTDYFNKIGYTGKYQIGDRVFGHWNKVPFIGTVGNDRCINGVDKEVTIHLDLPIRIDQFNHNFIIVKHTDIKQKLKEIE